MAIPSGDCRPDPREVIFTVNFQVLKQLAYIKCSNDVVNEQRISKNASRRLKAVFH